MNMEDYVSVEVAQELKNKGYNEPCDRFYCKMYDHILNCSDGLRFKRVSYRQLEEGDTLIPPLYEAQKWLREKHKIHIELSVDSQFHNIWFFVLYSLNYHQTINTHGGMDSYEEALNEGIKEAIKYI